MKKYCFEYHPTYFTYPCEPVELVKDRLVMDRALGMYDFGMGITAGEVSADTLIGAKSKVSRIISLSEKWETHYHPMYKDYFRVHAKLGQNNLYLWEKVGDEIPDKFTDQKQRFDVGDAVDKVMYGRHGEIKISYNGQIVYVRLKHENDTRLPIQFVYGFTDNPSKKTVLELDQYQVRPAHNPTID